MALNNGSLIRDGSLKARQHFLIEEREIDNDIVTEYLQLDGVSQMTLSDISICNWYGEDTATRVLNNIYSLSVSFV